MLYNELVASVDALKTVNLDLKATVQQAITTTNSNVVSSQASATTAQTKALEATAAAASSASAAQTKVDVLRADIATATGSAGIGHKTDMAGSFLRTLQNFMNDHRNIRDFSGIYAGNGLIDDSASLTAMGVALGYIIIPSGTFRISTNLTVDVPIFFQEGGSVSVDVGFTLTINNRINSSNQWIFKGLGSVKNMATTKGEDSKTVMAGWFGVVPTNSLVTDQTANIQRALNYFTWSPREGILQFESGSYHVNATMYVPRGVAIAGRGTRRTVFRVSGQNFTVWETQDNACKFMDFQFEVPLGGDGVRTAPYIHVKHNTCEIYNIWMYPTTVGILVDGIQSTIQHIRATVGLDPKTAGTDTSLIWCRASSFNIADISALNTSFGPHHLVRIGETTSISGGFVTDVSSTVESNPVFLDARACAISRITVGNLLSNTSTGSFESVLKISAAGAFVVSNIVATGLCSTGIAQSLLHIEAAGTSIVSNVTLGAATIQGSAGYGIRLLATDTAVIRNISVASDVDVSSRTTRLDTTGSVSALVIPPSVRGSGFSSAVIENFSLGTDSVRVISDFRTAIFAGTLIITTNSTGVYGGFAFRAASSSNHVTQMYGSATMATSTSVLTGTTGTAGKFTIGINKSGELVLENRTGGGLTVCATMMAGN